jgi:hypothetical protein
MCETTYVTPAPRISIGQPRPSNILALLNQFEVPDTEVAYNLDGKTEAGTASADDEDFFVK